MKRSSALLIVDDDRDVLHAARVALAAFVDRIDTATNTDGLEERLKDGNFSAVLVDMNFAFGARDGAAGMDALRRIVAVDPELAVVLMTAYGALSVAVEGLKQGAADFVLKPWRNQNLVNAVERAIELTHSRRSVAVVELSVVEREAIERALEKCHRNISLAATALGLSRAALYRRMAKYGL